MSADNRENDTLLQTVKEIAKASADGLLEAELCKKTKLQKLIRGDFLQIKKVWSEICKKFEKSSSAELPGIYMWLFDNFYIIENEYDTFSNTLKKAPLLPSVDKLPRVYVAALRFCRYSDAPLSEHSCSEILQALKNNCTLILDEYFCAGALFRAALITRVKEILFEYNQAQDRLSPKKEEKYAKSLGNTIASLRYVSYHDFDSEAHKSEVDEILCLDPSKAYSNMTNSTKNLYLHALCKKAKALGVSETKYAKRLLERANSATSEKERHIGYPLLKTRKSTKYAYFISLTGITLITMILLVLISPLCIFALLPVWEAVKQLTDFVFSRAVKSFPLARMELTEIPDDSPVLVVITSLLLGEKNDAELFDRLERIYLSNGGKNVYFGILGDISDFSSAKAPSDEAVINYAYGRIDALNRKYGNSFILLERRRSYSKSEEAFMGWERKRGAVVELVRLLCGKATTFSSHSCALAKEILGNKKIKYVVTLDADTNLPIDAVKDMCSLMLHPLNTPVIDKKKGIVTSGHAIMQPKCAPDLAAATRTPFSRLFCGVGGADIYSSASFDIYQSIFGEGIFCGKGIFDVEAFSYVIDERCTFPEDTILSHDCLEGAKLRSALITDIELTDGFPKHELSYLKRRHRWVRGDIQNLIFLLDSISFGKNDRRKNNINALSRFKLFDNARSAAVPCFAFFCVFLAPFTSPFVRTVLLLSSLAYHFIPVLLDLASMLFSLAFKCVARRFFSKGVTTGIWQSIMRMIFGVAMLPKIALSSVDAIFRSLYRMLVSRKKLLEWQTAAQSDAGDGSLLMFVHKNIFCAFAGFLLFAFSPSGFLRAVALLWLAFPIICYHTSFDKKSEDTHEEKAIKAKSREYAKDIWRFFSENVTAQENHLPPDNIQLAPQENVAHRTSPTNIGLYLLSTLCARDFGFITTDELEKRIANTVSVLEKMPKWHGHLYNWYDTENLLVLPPRYISTVDSGNLTACLITLKEGLREYVFESTSLIEIIARIEKLEGDTDYRLLYNKKRNLFSLGAEIKPGGEYTINDGCYDLLMSEARTISFIQCAKRNVPKKHWQALSRTVVGSGGYIGLYSWTGTAFEYFMPPIFLPVYKNSLFYEALLFALRAQRSRQAKSSGTSVWGISESGYFSFDSEMNYRYKAFGVPCTALKSGLEKDLVISPYSSFLSMCIGKRRALANLERLHKLGYYGKYGFFEAIDFTPRRSGKKGSVVKSYMSHHLGMSLTALCNAAFDGILTKRFMNDRAMASARELLEERIPVNAGVRRIKKGNDIPTQRSYQGTSHGKIYTGANPCAPKVCIISDGNVKCTTTSLGHFEISDGSILINHCDFEKYECTNSLYCFAHYQNKTLSPSLLPGINPRETVYSLKATGGYTELCSRLPGVLEFSQSTTITRSELAVICVKLFATPKNTNHDKESRSLEFAFCFTPVLTKKEHFLSHMSFSSLFLEAEFIKESNILLYRRRMRNEGEKEVLLGVALSDINAPFVFDTRADDCFTYKHSPGDFSDIFSQSSKNNLGACIRPYCKIRTEIAENGDRYTSELLICQGTSKDKIIRSIENARKKSFEEKVRALSDVSEKFTTSAGIGMFGADKSPSAAERLLPGIIFGSGSLFHTDKIPTHIGMDKLWRHGISGDYPIVSLVVISGALIPKLEKFIRTAKLLKLCKTKFDLCIIYSETERYRRPIASEICELIAKCDCTELISKSGGGIFLIDRSDAESYANAILLRSCIKIDILYDSKALIDTPVGNELRLPVTLPNLSVDFPKKSFPVISTPRGDFEKNCFIVRKDRELKSPHSHILTGRRISCLVTSGSLGYTWTYNAQNRRITPFRDDALSETSGERIYLISEKRAYDLCAMARYVTFAPGEAVYVGIADAIEYSVTVYLSEKLGTKYCDVRLKFPAGSTESRKLMYYAAPVMGKDSSENKFIQYSEKNGVLLFKNPFSDFFANYTGFICALKSNEDSVKSAKYIKNRAALFLPGSDISKGECDCASVYLVAKESDNCEYYRFALGAVKDTGNIQGLLDFSIAAMSDGISEHRKAVNFAHSLIPDIKMLPDNNNITALSYSVLFNFFLPYQNGAARFIARSGFYQSGGAYGFRDQLQDSLCLMYSNPHMTRAHIYRCCARQFVEGDVLHWWHDMESKSSGKNIGRSVCRGVRTLCSDDYLWLPYVCAKYFAFSGDCDFLNKNVHYIDGEQLSEAQSEKYIEAKKGEISESVYMHCVRAIDRGISRIGQHGLPLIGSCDWCDGYSNVGTRYDGESVWLGMFLYIVLDLFCDICKKRKDTEAHNRYSHAKIELLEAIRNCGYSEKDGQYLRGYYADGSPLGSQGNDECKIDLLAQCFAPYLSGSSTSQIYKVSKNAYDRLFDEKYSIFKLFDPPFKNSRQNPGYIKGYVAGIRENGGQYTHAAVWGARGLLCASKILYRAGEYEKSAELSYLAERAVNAQNTVLRTIGALGDDAKNAYSCEPYYLAGDIYSNPEHYGRGGWTIYTGAAGWYYTVLLRDVLGIKLSGVVDGDASIEIECLRPMLLPELLCGMTLYLSLKDKNNEKAQYYIKYYCGDTARITVDGEETVGKIKIEGGSHRISVYLQNIDE